jgi:hypothetical protein
MKISNIKQTWYKDENFKHKTDLADMERNLMPVPCNELDTYINNISINKNHADTNIYHQTNKKTETVIQLCRYRKPLSTKPSFVW